MTAWSLQKVAALRQLVVRGRTQSQISRELGVTKSAAQNMINRLGFARLRPLHRAPRRPHHAPMPQQINAATSSALADIFPPLNVRLADAQEFQCRWVVGNPKDGPGALICGQPCFYRSWCPYHYSVGRTGNARRA